ncbi:MAG: RNA methyltransferase [Chitinophagales bacterium]|nr:RNA methyltransferase [Chitinophagales bacterium]
MLSKSFEKYINSLKQKKYRIEYKRFIAEGDKIAGELLNSNLPVEKICATPNWITANESLLEKRKALIEEVSSQQMKKITALSTPSEVLLLAKIPDYKIDQKEVLSNLNLVLDGIRDPGNLGAIIRIADWFNIPQIFCSGDCVDAYNPKVIQASMGSICRIKVFEKNPGSLFEEYPAKVFAATFNGENIFQAQLSEQGFIIIGNEARGISKELEKYITKKITIPQFGKAESLNAAVATGIVCAAFRK